MSLFEQEYKKLNKLQKEAVDTIEGPVMVVAGPGTGKTQILALRIGKILKTTDINPDSILCLTFTRSGVNAMKNRLLQYIGLESNKVKVSTFHAFAIEIIEKYYTFLDFPQIPNLIKEDEAVFLVDDILENGSWDYLRPRTNPQMYFNDLKSLISILKRERITVEEFEKQIKKDIEFLENDPESISSRGESKGKVKKEIEKKIESLSRTLEVVEFYRIYEERKRESFLMDYDDVLEFVVSIVSNSEDARADIYENYQYVLVDEHQDSSGVQNSFLKAVWGEVENPNIFVVGDDRQLIYAFSGANLSYFEEFANYFGRTKLITLLDNYRSTSRILDLADSILESSISKGKLKSNKGGGESVFLREYEYPRDEILSAGLYFKSLIEQGESLEEMAILVPKNHHVRTANSILKNLNLPVLDQDNLSLFSLNKTDSFLRVLRIIDKPFDSVSVSLSLLDKYSGIDKLEAHRYLEENKKENLSLDNLLENRETGLFANENNIFKWGKTLKSLLDKKDKKLSFLISEIGNIIYINNSEDNHDLLENVEFVRTFIHLALMFETKNLNPTIGQFLNYIERLKTYGNHIDVATLGVSKGIQVMTLHKSKGLEYKYVWIAHMNEETFMSEKRSPFALPEYVRDRLAKRSQEDAKRELYVAITRAKEYCTLSYANLNYTGGELNLASIIQELPDIHFIKKRKDENELELLENSINGPKIFTSSIIDLALEKGESRVLDEINEFVRENYKDTKVSVSLLNNFFECPFKWYFRNFLKLPEPKSVSLALGSAVHNTIEFILKNKILPKAKELESFINQDLRKEGISNDKEILRLSKTASNIIEDFLASFYKNIAKDFSSERSVSFLDKDLGINIYGKIDLTENTSDGRIVITDFKTGKPKTKTEIEKIDEEGRLSAYMRQLAMYSYLVKQSQNREVDISQLFFLEREHNDKNKVYITNIDNEKIDLLLRDIKDYVESLENHHWMDRKCNFKSFGGKNDPCPYCALAKNIFLK